MVDVVRQGALESCVPSQTSVELVLVVSRNVEINLAERSVGEQMMDEHQETNDRAPGPVEFGVALDCQICAAVLMVRHVSDDQTVRSIAVIDN